MQEQVLISIETILQVPANNTLISKKEIPIIITTHKTASKLLNKAIKKIENLKFVISKIVIINIDKSLN